MKLTLPTVFLAVSLGLVARANVTSTFSQSYPLSATGTLHLENVNGSVEITGWEKNEVSLVAEKSAPNAEDLERLEISVDAQPNRVSVKTERKKKSFFDHNWRGEVKYQLKIPAHAHLDKIAVVNSKVAIRGVSGTMNLESVNGEIEAHNVAATGHFKTVNGSLSIGYDQLTGVNEITFDTVNGSCALQMPANSNLRVESHSVNGNVHCDFPVTVEKTGWGHFQAHVGEGGPSVRLNAVNGDLNIKTK